MVMSPPVVVIGSGAADESERAWYVTRRVSANTCELSWDNIHRKKTRFLYDSRERTHARQKRERNAGMVCRG